MGGQRQPQLHHLTTATINLATATISLITARRCTARRRTANRWCGCSGCGCGCTGCGCGCSEGSGSLRVYELSIGVVRRHVPLVATHKQRAADGQRSLTQHSQRSGCLAGDDCRYACA
jgi:hypothetical protein